LPVHCRPGPKARPTLRHGYQRRRQRLVVWRGAARLLMLLLVPLSMRVLLLSLLLVLGMLLQLLLLCMCVLLLLRRLRLVVRLHLHVKQLLLVRPRPRLRPQRGLLQLQVGRLPLVQAQLRRRRQHRPSLTVPLQLRG
jgi:hypothetical protein